MEERLNCLRCGSEMKHLKQEHIQLGKTGWIFGDWPNLIAGGLYVDILCCSGYGRLEFFTAAPDQIEYEEGQMAQHQAHLTQVDLLISQKLHISTTVGALFVLIHGIYSPFI